MKYNNVFKEYEKEGICEEVTSSELESYLMGNFSVRMGFSNLYFLIR